MSDFRYASKQYMLEFIELYRSQTCLWKIKSKDYNDREKKVEAYDLMIQKLKEIDANANREVVVKKINSLRSGFRKERKKIRRSIESGDSGDDIYRPKLWYYDTLSFLTDQETHDMSMSKVENDSYCTEDATIEVWVEQEEENESVHSRSPNKKQKKDVKQETTDIKPRRTDIKPQRMDIVQQKMDIQQQNASEDIMGLVARLMASHDDDQYDIVGKNIASKLRNVSNEQRIYAERMINEILFEAELGTLNRYCRLHQPVMLQAVSTQNVQSPLTTQTTSPLVLTTDDTVESDN